MIPPTIEYPEAARTQADPVLLVATQASHPGSHITVDPSEPTVPGLPLPRETQSPLTSREYPESQTEQEDPIEQVIQLGRQEIHADPTG